MNEDLKRELLAYRPSLNASGRVFSFKEIKRSFRSACEDAEIPWGEFTPGGLIFHDLRHTCATRLGDAKATAEQIMTVLGHTDIRTAKRYTHVTDRGLREAMDSLSTQRGRVVKIKGRR